MSAVSQFNLQATKAPARSVIIRFLVKPLPGSDAAFEALYWLGVSRYKSSGDPTALQQTAEAFKTRYRDSTWAKKASVWAK